MKVRIMHIIRQVIEEDSENWKDETGEHPVSEEDVLRLVKLEIEQDVDYLIGAIENPSIDSFIIPDSQSVVEERLREWVRDLKTNYKQAEALLTVKVIERLEEILK